MAISTLILSMLTTLPVADASIGETLVTCTNLISHNERILRTGACKVGKEAQANWHKNISDTNQKDGAGFKTISICENKESSKFKYQLIKKRCLSSQIQGIYYRMSAIPQTPVIANVSVTGHDSTRITLRESFNGNDDAPNAFYTITSSHGEKQVVWSSNSRDLVVTNLKELSEYAFTISATNIDGSSPNSSPSTSVTTQKYIAPIVTATQSNFSTASSQISIISSDTATATIPVGATSVAIPAPTLGNPTISFGAQSAAITANVQSAINPVGSGSTPFRISGSNKIIDISLSGLSGPATVCLDGGPSTRLWHFVSGSWVDITTSNTSSQVCGSTSTFSPFTSAELVAPIFSLPRRTVNVAVNSSLSGFSATVTEGRADSFSISPSLPVGLSLDTATGVISGTPTETQTSTSYTVTAINAAGSTSQTFTLNVTRQILTCAQGGVCSVGSIGPGGGRVFYETSTPFACGPTLGSSCRYLEAAPDSGTASWNNSANYYRWSGNTSMAVKSGGGWNAIGQGYRNTLAILAQDSSCNSCAGAAAQAYRGPNNLTDWYLPSKLELAALYANRSLLSSYPDSWFSSSSESDESADRSASVIYDHWFGPSNNPGLVHFANKSDNGRVHPIRAFNSNYVGEAPVFELSSVAETVTQSTLAVGFNVISTGDIIRSLSISGTPHGMTFNTSTGTLSGTPDTLQNATRYTVTATNEWGSTTATFTLTVTAPLIAPSLTISRNTVNAVVGLVARGFTSSTTGGLVESFTVSPNLPAGLVLDSNTGALTGTPSESITATVFTVSANNTYGSSSRTFTLTVKTLATATCAEGGACQIGDVGPGGGKVFYVSSGGFSCGATLVDTCHYLEAAPDSGTSAWNNSANYYRWSGITNQAVKLGGGWNAIGQGYRNTLAMLAQDSSCSSCAGAAAQAYRGPNNLTDWYLPSKLELAELYRNRSILTSYPDIWFWTSSESDEADTQRSTFVVYDVWFGPTNNAGMTAFVVKDSNGRVHPIRSF